MKHTWHKRLSLLALAALVGWLAWVTPVWAAMCAGMSARALPAGCLSDGGGARPAPQMLPGCVLHLGGADAYLGVQPASRPVPPPAVLPAAPPAEAWRKPRLLPAVVFVDVSPPARPRPLYLYHGVFLK